PAFSPPILLAALRALLDRATRLFASPAAFIAARWACVGVAALICGGGLRRDSRLTGFWASLYLRNAEQLDAVHLAVGRYLRTSAPEGTPRVASFDIGALRWASRFEIVDLAGTSDARALRYEQLRRLPELIRETRPDY